MNKREGYVIRRSPAYPGGKRYFVYGGPLARSVVPPLNHIRPDVFLNPKDAEEARSRLIDGDAWAVVTETEALGLDATPHDQPVRP